MLTHPKDKAEEDSAKIGSSRFSNHERTITDPDSVSNAQLLEMPLSTLSKTLPQTTSSRATMGIYLRWIEVHRKQPSDLSKNWDNCVIQWAQSLKARYFHKREVVDELEKWKEAHAPFGSESGRYPPTRKDITDAFDGKRASRPREDQAPRDRGDSYRPAAVESFPAIPTRPRGHQLWQSEYDKPPPKNYICNRCSQPGHHLQVCPTNLDPSYDSPPEPDYFCEVCRMYGEHFKSLCPKNQDPYSIIMKRKAAGIRTPPPKSLLRNRDYWNDESPSRGKEWSGRIDRIGRDEGRLKHEFSEPPNGSPHNDSPLDDKRIRVKQELDAIERTKEQLFKEDVYDFQDLLANNGGSRIGDNHIKKEQEEDSPKSNPSPGKKRAGSFDAPRQPKMIRFADTTTTIGDEVEMTGVDMLAEQSNYQKKTLHSPLYYQDSPGSPSFTALSGPRFATRPKDMNPDEIDLADSEVDSADGMDVDDAASKLAKVYSEHVLKLMQRLPQMSEEVNKIQKRVTALDMWKREEDRRVDLAAFAPNVSPPWSPFASEHGADDPFEDMARREPVVPQFDGVGEDFPAERSARARGRKPGQISNEEMEMDLGSSQETPGSLRLNKSGSSANPAGKSLLLGLDESVEPFPSFQDTSAGIKKENVKPSSNTLAKYQVRWSKLATEQARAKDYTVTSTLDELKQFGQSFKLTTPMPADIADIMAMDSGKQREVLQETELNSNSANLKK